MLADLPQIQGKQPDSKEEYWVAMALDKLKLPYIFQFEIFGGSRIRGGIMIDFLVFNPFGTPVEVLGEYWHTGELGADDKFRQGLIEQEFNRKVVNLWTQDLIDPETTYSVVRRELM
jgi:hypothetical protein